MYFRFNFTGILKKKRRIKKFKLKNLSAAQIYWVIVGKSSIYIFAATGLTIRNQLMRSSLLWKTKYRETANCEIKKTTFWDLGHLLLNIIGQNQEVISAQWVSKFTHKVLSEVFLVFFFFYKYLFYKHFSCF